MAVAPEVREQLETIKSLVDDHWDRMSQLGGRGSACLLGLVGLALNGLDWESTYDFFDPNQGAQLIPVVEYMASIARQEDKFLLRSTYVGAHSFVRIYRYQDRNCRNSIDVHNFLDRCLNG